MRKQNSGNNNGFSDKTVLFVALSFGLGIAFGAILDLFATNTLTSLIVEKILTPVSTMYLNALKFIAVPVAFFSILNCISGMGELKSLSRIGGKVLGMFALTSLTAIITGLFVFDLMKPADGFAMELQQQYSGTAIQTPSLLDTLIGIIPDNLFSPFIEANMLQIIFIAVLLGIGLTLLGKQAQPLLTFVTSCNALFLKVTSVLIALVPIATFCAMAKLIINMGLFALLPLLRLFATILSGMLIMMLIYAILLLLAGLNPLIFFQKWAATLLLAFSLNCASATVPITLATCQNKLGISPKVCSLSIPLGATINMDGTCIYLGVCSLFLAQIYGIEMTIANQAAIILSIFVLSVGAPGIPGSGLVCLSVLAVQLGIPMEGLGFVMGVDKLFGMMRSATNVTSDVVNTTIVAASEKLLDKQIYYSHSIKQAKEPA